MSGPLSLGFACSFAGTVLILGFGLVYLFRREFMPYHAVAVGQAWAQVDPRARTLYLAMLRGVGGTSVAVAFLELTVLLVQLREGIDGALWAAPMGGLIVAATALHAMAMVRRHTPARPPWALGIAAGALQLTALCAFLWVSADVNPFS